MATPNTFFGMAGLVKRSMDDENATTELRQWQREDRAQNQKLNAMRMTDLEQQMADRSAARETDQAVRGELAKGHGLTPISGQRSGDIADRGTRFEGRNKSNMFNDAAEVALKSGDTGRYQQLKGMGDQAKQDAIRELVEGYMYRGVRGAQLAEILNSSGRARIDPASIQDDGQGNISGLDTASGKTAQLNIGSLGMAMKMIDPGEWEGREVDGQFVLYNKKNPKQTITLGQPKPMHKTVKGAEGQPERVFDERKGEFVGGGAEAPQQAGIPKDTAARMWKALIVGKGEFDSLDPDAQAKVHQSYLNGAQLIRDGVTYPDGRPLDPEQAALYGRALIDGTVSADGVETVNGAKRQVFKRAGSAAQGAPRATGEKHNGKEVYELPDGRLVDADGNVLKREGAAQQPAIGEVDHELKPETALPGFTGMSEEQLTKELEVLSSGSAAGRNPDRLSAVQAEIQRRGLREDDLKGRAKTQRAGSDTRKEAMLKLEHIGSANARRSWLASHPQEAAMFSKEEQDKLINGKFSEVGSGAKFADGGRVRARNSRESAKRAAQASRKILVDPELAPPRAAFGMDERPIQRKPKTEDRIPNAWGLSPRRPVRMADGGKVMDEESKVKGYAKGGLVRKGPASGGRGHEYKDWRGDYKPVKTGSGQTTNVKSRDFGESDPKPSAAPAPKDGAPRRESEARRERSPSHPPGRAGGLSPIIKPFRPKTIEGVALADERTGGRRARAERADRPDFDIEVGASWEDLDTGKKGTVRGWKHAQRGGLSRLRRIGRQ